MKAMRFLLILLATVVLPSFAANIHIHKDQLFTQARARLIKDKWKPLQMHTNDDYGYENVEKQLVKRGFKEVDSCSIDSSRCILFYKKGDQCLRLDTIGEQVKFMKVVQWSDECPDAP